MGILAGMVDCYYQDIEPQEYDYSINVEYPHKLPDEELMYSHGLTDGDAYMESFISSPGYPGNEHYMRGYNRALKEFFTKNEWLEDNACALESDELQSLDKVK